MILLEEQRGLLYRQDRLHRVLLPGDRFVPLTGRLETYSVNEEFKPRSTTLETALTNKALGEQLQIVDVPDNHIALHWFNGLLQGVLTVGKRAFWKGVSERRFELVDLDGMESAGAYGRHILLHAAVRDWVLSYSIEPYQVGLLIIDKVFSKTLEPGNWFFWKGTKSVNVEKIDLRQQQAEISGQEILTRDKVPVRLNFFCQYKIVDPKKLALDVKEPEGQLHLFLQLALREYVGTLSLDELLEKKEEVGKFVAANLKEHAALLGLEVGLTGIKDVILPGEIRDILNQVLVAEKKAQANVITRREETASTRSLLNTAKLMEENEVLYRLKELEYVERISAQVHQISLGGGSQILDQLREIFLPADKKK